MMKVCIVGTGYVGLVTGSCLAELNHEVVCVDKDHLKIQQLIAGEMPFYEPGLEALVQANMAEGRLKFTTDLAQAVRESSLCMIAVGTPQNAEGGADLRFVYEAASDIADAMTGYRVIVIKSTVPVGTGEQVKSFIASQTPFEFAMASNPEFLRQGGAVEDFMKPDRIVAGANSPDAMAIIRDLYEPLLRHGVPFVGMDLRSAEMTKYVANAFLATKISFINEMSNLCERVGADILNVRNGIVPDRRIGREFLSPGLGYGGSCFPKDVKALMKTAQDNDSACPILKAVDRTNQWQRYGFIEKINQYYDGRLSGKTFALWGLAFKPDTDDLREAPSLTIAHTLISAGAQIRVYDPKAMEKAMAVLPSDGVTYCTSPEDAVMGVDALLIVTEWKEFSKVHWGDLRVRMKWPVVFDGRNLYTPERMRQRGFDYMAMGRQSDARKIVGVTMSQEVLEHV